jgi:hypothetical protein
METTIKLNEIIKYYDETSLNECIKKASKSLANKYVLVPQIIVGVLIVLLIGSQLIPIICKINQTKIILVAQLIITILFIITFIVLIKGYEKLPKEVYNLNKIPEKDSRLYLFANKLLHSKIHLPEINSSIALLDYEYGFSKDKKQSFIGAYFFAIVLPIVFLYFDEILKTSIVFSGVILSGFIVPIYYVLLKTLISEKKIKMEQIYLYLNRIRIDWNYKEEKKNLTKSST